MALKFNAHYDSFDVHHATNFKITLLNLRVLVRSSMYYLLLVVRVRLILGDKANNTI